MAAEEKLRSKEDKLWYRRYLERAFISMLVSRFGVKKGVDDIRCVWDSKRNGHNETLWAPSFMLATFDNMCDLVTGDSWQEDMDVGECFLNFMMHYKEQHAFGVRMVRERKGEVKEFFLRFTRLFFGCKCSPYVFWLGAGQAEPTYRS